MVGSLPWAHLALIAERTRFLIRFERGGLAWVAMAEPVVLVVIYLRTTC